MTTTVHKAPRGMVFVSDADYAELLRLRAERDGESAWIGNRFPPYGKYVLVKETGKTGRVYIAKRVKRYELRGSDGKVVGVAVFMTRESVYLFGINLWTEFPK